MSVYSKLSEARKQFHALELKKSGSNKFAGYNYFELADFLVPALRVFHECGLLSVTTFDKDVASMKIIDIDKPDDFIVFTSPFGSASLKGNHEIQNIGAVETYQRRYLWVTAMEIVEHDAIDSTEPIKRDAPKKVDSFRDTPKQDAFDKLQPEVQDFLRRAAQQVTAAMPDATKAKDILLMALEEWPDEDPAQLKIGAWHLLDSKTRAAIKRLETA